jgi:hypothetical protein
MAHADDTHKGPRHVARDPAIDRWRCHYERDRREFERAHGRPPANHYELARWLSNAPQ